MFTPYPHPTGAYPTVPQPATASSLVRAGAGYPTASSNRPAGPRRPPRTDRRRHTRGQKLWHPAAVRGRARRWVRGGRPQLRALLRVRAQRADAS